jgi:hypothetical protein
MIDMRDDAEIAYVALVLHAGCPAASNSNDSNVKYTQVDGLFQN